MISTLMQGQRQNNSSISDQDEDDNEWVKINIKIGNDNMFFVLIVIILFCNKMINKIILNIFLFFYARFLLSSIPFDR